MPELAKAMLQPINGDSPAQPLGAAVEVQFNPATLQIQLAAASDAGRTPARQSEQHLGSGNLTLTCDLHFDTADEGTTETPRNVREKTTAVAQFMLPKEGSSGPPPRVRFQWGDFVVDGVMGSYTENLDLFSPQGVPLRAKVSITIRGQNPKFSANVTGPGANPGTGATAPGAPAGAPGTAGFGASLSVGAGISLGGGLSLGASAGLGTGVAIGGESAAEFAARMGVDPSAWRGLAAGLDSTVSLPAGKEIDFSTTLATGAGIGTTSGVETAAKAEPAAAVGLAGEGAAPPRPGSVAGTREGFALAAAGGVQAAVETVKIVESSSAADDAKRAYDPAAAAPAPSAAVPPPPQAEQPRPALRAAELPVAAAARPAPPAPPPPHADERAVSFGRGVPLRPNVAGAATDRAGTLGGTVLVETRAPRRATAAPTSTDPTQFPWLALRAGGAEREAADRAQERLRPGTCRRTADCGCGCGCGGGCR